MFYLLWLVRRNKEWQYALKHLSNKRLGWLVARQLEDVEAVQQNKAVNK